MMAEIQEVITGEITGLPEPILHRILSFLPIKEAIRTSILSKAFLSASRANPTLEFSDELFFNNRFNRFNGSSHWMWDQKTKKEKYEKFCGYVNSIVKRYHEEKIGIENFTLKLDDDQICKWDSQFVERCIKIAVGNGVRCLDLSIGKFSVPQFVLGAKSLVDLRIRMCNMIMTRHDQKIMCDRLKQLHLRFVCLDDEMLHKILKSCQLIEVLEIWNCNGLKNVNVITKIDNLKKCTLALLNSAKVEVSLAPSLESLICWHNTTKPDGEWIPCGITLTASEYPNLKVLSLRSIGSTSEIFLMNLDNKFPHIKELEIMHCDDLRIVKISSKSLRRILLKDNNKIEEAEFDVPSLAVFDYESDFKIKPKFCFKATSRTWYSRIKIHCGGIADNVWLLKLKELLAKFVDSEKIIVAIEISGGIAFDVDKIRKYYHLINTTIHHEPQKVQELSLDIHSKLPLSSLVSALDGFFTFICRPKCVTYCYSDREFAILLYKALMFRRNYSKEIRFWQRKLKRLEFVVIDRQASWKKVEFVEEGPPEFFHWDALWNKTLYFSLEWSTTTSYADVLKIALGVLV